VTDLFDLLRLDDLGRRRLSPYTVKTIHAFGLNALRRASESSADGGGARLIHKTEICDLIGAHLEAVSSDAAFKPERDDVCAGLAPKEAIEMLYNVRAERLKQLMDVDDDSLGAVSKEVLRRVRDDMLPSERSGGQRLVDFDEIIRELADSAQPIINTHDLLVVDEAQDLNRCQMQIVTNCINAGNRNILILGDDSQGIFHFSGAVHNTMKTIIQACETGGVRTSRHALFQNHRSTNQIVRASELLLPPSDCASRAGVRGNGDGPDVEACIAPTPEVEARRIAARAVDLVCKGMCDPSDIVILRHANWSWNDALLGAFKAEAIRKGVPFPVCILGAPTNTTISMKALAIIQVALGSERFVSDDLSAGLDLLRTFAKSVRCTRGVPALTMRVFAKVWETYRHGDIATLFMKRQNELMQSFREMLKEEEEGATNKVITTTLHPKKQKTLEGAYAVPTPSLKERNFIKTVSVLGNTCRVTKERLADAIANRVPMRPAVQDHLHASEQTKKSPSSSVRPDDFRTNLGGVAWIVVRDLVDHPFERTCANTDDSESLKLTIERDEIRSLVSALDVPLDDAPTYGVGVSVTPTVMDAAAAAWEAPISKMLGTLNDKEVEGKAKFATIHKYKGKEAPVAFVCGLKNPYGKVDAARRAALGPLHRPACNNKNGRNKCTCEDYNKQLDDIMEAMGAEKQRLHYVAASRAECRLYLSASASKYPLAVLENSGVGEEWQRMV
jgi:superfamily I DNA/RNA helicase